MGRQRFVFVVCEIMLPDLAVESRGNYPELRHGDGSYVYEIEGT